MEYSWKLLEDSTQGGLDWPLKPVSWGFQCHVMNLAGCTQFPA